MVWVGGVVNAPPNPDAVPVPADPRPRVQARYVAGLHPLAEMGPLLRAHAAAVGMEQADVWGALSDGGAGLEDFLRVNVPRVEAIIIGYWHVSEYLADLAEAACPADRDARAALRREWCRVLKEEGGWTTLNLLREYQPPSKTKAWKTAWSTVEPYLANHAHRMAYPEYIANGWSIGSGAIESACRHVIGQRMKGPHRWGAPGAHEIAALRALFCSEKGAWAAFWSRPK